MYARNPDTTHGAKHGSARLGLHVLYAICNTIFNVHHILKLAGWNTSFVAVVFVFTSEVTRFLT